MDFQTPKMITFELDEERIIDNYNFSENYIENLNNISLEICIEFSLNGKTIVGQSLLEFSKQINFINLRLLKKQNPQGKSFDNEDISWYFEESLKNYYICFLFFNNKLKKHLNNLKNLDVSTEFISEYQINGELELSISKIFKDSNKLEVSKISNIYSNFIFCIVL